MDKLIEGMGVESLKALAYDNLAQIEQCQFNLKALNQELQNRQKPPITTTSEVTASEPVEEK